MKYLVFCCRDRAADVFGSPFQHASRGGAIRAFADSVNAVGDTGLIAKHPDDFDLYYLGTFDDSNGMYATGVPEMISVGKDLVIRK